MVVHFSVWREEKGGERGERGEKEQMMVEEKQKDTERREIEGSGGEMRDTS